MTSGETHGEVHPNRAKWPYCHGMFEFFPPIRKPVDFGFVPIPCHDPITLTAASMAATAIGTGVSAAGTIAGGNAAKSAADFKAQQFQMQGQTATAEGQRSMLEEQRKTGLLQSTLQARAAGSGAGATDPTVLALGSQIAGRGEYGALTDLFQGQNRAAGLTDEANAAIATGKAQQIGSDYSAVGTVASGAGSMFRTYGNRNNPYFQG